MKAWRRHNAKKEAREHALANSALNNGDVKKWHAHEMKAHRAGKHAMGRHGKGAVDIPMGPPPLADGLPPPIPVLDQENIPPVVIPDGPPVVVPNISNVSGLPPSPPNSDPIVVPPGGAPTGPIVVPPSNDDVPGFPPSYSNRGSNNFGGSSGSIPVIGENGFGGPGGDNKDNRGYGDHTQHGGSGSYRGLSYPIYGTPYVIPVSGSFGGPPVSAIPVTSFGGPPIGAIPVLGSSASSEFNDNKFRDSGDSGPSSSGQFDFGGPPPGGIPVLGGDNKSEGGDSISIRDSEDKFNKSDDWKKNLPPGFDMDGVTILPSVIVNGPAPDMVITPPPGTYAIAAPPVAVPVAAPAAAPVVPAPVAAPLAVPAVPAAVEITAMPPPPVVVTSPPLPAVASGSSIMLPPVAGAPAPTILPPPVVAPTILPPSPLGSVVMPFEPFPFMEDISMRSFPNGMQFPPEPIVMQEFGGTMEAAVETTYWSDPVLVTGEQIIEERTFLPPVPPPVQLPIVEASAVTLPPMHAGATREVAPPFPAPFDAPPMPGSAVQLPPRQMSPVPPPQNTYMSPDLNVIPQIPLSARSSPTPMNNWEGSTVSSRAPDTARTFMPITPRQESSQTQILSMNGPIVGPAGSTPFPTHQGHRGNEIGASAGYGSLMEGASFDGATKLPPRYVDGGNRGAWTGRNDTGYVQMQPIPIQSQPSFSGRAGSPALGGSASPMGSETVSSIGRTLTRDDLHDTWSSNGYMGVPQVPLRGSTPLPPQPDTYSKHSVSAAYPSTYRFDNERMSDSGSVRSARSSGSWRAFPNAR